MLRLNDTVRPSARRYGPKSSFTYLINIIQVLLRAVLITVHPLYNQHVSSYSLGLIRRKLSKTAQGSKAVRLCSMRRKRCIRPESRVHN